LFFGGFNTNELIGYCILEPASGDITQIAVDSRHRRKGVATKLLAEALKFNRHDSLKIVNTDIRCDSITHFLESVNIPPTGKQFEMIKKL
jgi:GNAT superfamily N-acetyltransferase